MKANIVIQLVLFANTCSTIHVDLHLADNGAFQMAVSSERHWSCNSSGCSQAWEVIWLGCYCCKANSNHFSTPEKPVELTGRSCRERMDRVLEKYKSEESRCLKRYLYILMIYREALSFQLYKCFNILGQELRTSSPNWNSFAKI